MTDGIAVILTALNVEYAAVRKHVTDLHVHRHAKGTRFEVGTLAGTHHRVALAQVGMGNHAAAVLTERAIDEFSPVAVVFCGIAGALWPDIALGDVVVATHVAAYHGGTSEDDGLKARPRTWPTDHAADQIARHVARNRDWRDRLPEGAGEPEVRFGTIAAGEVVQDSATSREARWLRQHYNDAIAIEMEGAGIAQAGHLSRSPVVIVRGISDHADGHKIATDGANWQPKAAANSAAFATRLAEELIEESAEEGLIPMQDKNPPPGTVTNYAAGGVGVQAGHITGSTIWVNGTTSYAAPTDVAGQLAELRNMVRQAWSAGNLDEATHNAAQEELTLAATALENGSTDGRNTLTVALKRLRGLVGDVAELATKLATLILAVKASS